MSHKSTPIKALCYFRARRISRIVDVFSLTNLTRLCYIGISCYMRRKRDWLQQVVYCLFEEAIAAIESKPQRMYLARLYPSEESASGNIE